MSILCINFRDEKFHRTCRCCVSVWGAPAELLPPFSSFAVFIAGAAAGLEEDWSLNFANSGLGVLINGVSENNMQNLNMNFFEWEN